jgi:uncharacterized membrane protein
MGGFLFALCVVVSILVVVVVLTYVIDREADANDSG